MSEFKDLEQLFSGYKTRRLAFKRTERNPLSDEVTEYIASLLKEFFGEETEMDQTILTLFYYLYPKVDDPKTYAILIMSCLTTFVFDDQTEGVPLGNHLSIWSNSNVQALLLHAIEKHCSWRFDCFLCV